MPGLLQKPKAKALGTPPKPGETRVPGGPRGPPTPPPPPDAWLSRPYMFWRDGAWEAMAARAEASALRPGCVWEATRSRVEESDLRPGCVCGREASRFSTV